MILSNRATDPWRWRLALACYRLLAPSILLVALPAWLRKMAARDGWSTPFGERFGIYADDAEWSPFGRLHFHAVSVGETLIALKFLQSWRARHSDPVVLAVGTATAYQLAAASDIENLTVVYAPLDVHTFVVSYLNRFAPSMIILVEAEAWPELMTQCQHRGIRVSMINARLSSRSERRYQQAHKWIMPLFQKITRIGLQGPEDAARFTALGLDPHRLLVTGSIKFDPAAAISPRKRDEFSAIVDPIRNNRPIILAASTHEGEEILLAKVLARHDVLFVCVPRHAERRSEVSQSLASSGMRLWLRSHGTPPADSKIDVLIIDSTGELRDWTAHADIVIIGKSFLSTGGQNPAEAILAGKPVIVGPHMENFEPLTGQLLSADGILRVRDAGELSSVVTALLASPTQREIMVRRSRHVLEMHAGATERSIQMLESISA